MFHVFPSSLASENTVFRSSLKNSNFLLNNLIFYIFGVGSTPSTPTLTPESAPRFMILNRKKLDMKGTCIEFRSESIHWGKTCHREWISGKNSKHSQCEKTHQMEYKNKRRKKEGESDEHRGGKNFLLQLLQNWSLQCNIFLVLFWIFFSFFMFFFNVFVRKKRGYSQILIQRFTLYF